MAEKCFFCNSMETKYCGLCKHWFCARCNIKYDKRIIAMIKTKVPGWLTREELNKKLQAFKGKKKD